MENVINNLELIFTTAGVSVTAGLLIGNWLGKQSAKLEYHRGYLDGSNIAFNFIRSELFKKFSDAAGSKAGSGTQPDRPTIQ